MLHRIGSPLRAACCALLVLLAVTLWAAPAGAKMTRAAEHGSGLSIAKEPFGALPDVCWNTPTFNYPTQQWSAGTVYIGDFTTDHVQRITGHPPRSVDDFAREVLAPAAGR